MHSLNLKEEKMFQTLMTQAHHRSTLDQDVVFATIPTEISNDGKANKTWVFSLVLSLRQRTKLVTQTADHHGTHCKVARGIRTTAMLSESQVD